MTTQDIDKVLQVAASWVGYLEKISPDYSHYESKTAGAGMGNFTRFGRIADMVIGGSDFRNKDGFAWCCDFLISCLYESRAGHVDTTAPKGTLKVREDVRQWVASEIANGGPLTYFAGCAAWHGSFRRYGGISSTPSRGAFVLYLDAFGKPYHIGIVESVADSGLFTTIEGNTNLRGSNVDPNGGAVARKQRRNKGCIFLSKHVF